MNRSRVILGIVFIVIAGGLAVANLVLPEEKLMFMIGEENMPWVPVIVLGILGIIFVATGMQPKPEPREVSHETYVQDPEKRALDKRIETFAWGCFLIMLGGFALVPNDLVPKGLWSIGVGVILLGLNVVRYFYQIKMSGFTTFLGVLSIIFGITDMIGWTSLHGALLLIVLGANLLLKPWFEKRQLFRKSG